MNPYSIIVSLSIILLIVIVKKRSKKIDEAVFWKLLFFIFISSIFGAKIFHLLENIGTYLLYPELIELSKGYSILGAITFGYLVLIFFEKKYNLKLESLKISLFLFLPLVQAIGRFGNVFNNELLPFSYYEIVLNLINFLIIFLVSKKHRDLTEYLFFMNYGLIRVFIETLKSNYNFLFFCAVFFLVYGFLKIYKLLYKQ